MDAPFNFELALERGWIVPHDGEARRADYLKVHSFLGYQGHPSRPVGPTEPRPREEFDRLLALLDGVEFFEPFNGLLEQIGKPRMRIEPVQDAIDYWNARPFVPGIVASVCGKLDIGDSPNLIPRLVALFRNLEREHLPGEKDWANLDVIAVPGSRTIDRAAEAFRAYIRSEGHAFIVASGRVPYYDKPEDIPILESEANAAYLRLLGVPRARIVEEYTSRDTAENVEFLPLALNRVEGALGSPVRRMLLVTSPFHLARYRFNVESVFLGDGRTVFAIGSRASRYWAETYFLTDTKSSYSRERTMEVVFNEYVKIAYDLCARRKGPKDGAQRGAGA